MAYYTQRVRVYPSRSQKRNLAQHFGVARFIYNWALTKAVEEYETSKTRFDHNKMSKALTALRKDINYCWLHQSPRNVQQMALQNFRSAMQHFFRTVKGSDNGVRVGFPTHKSKHDKQSCSYNDKPTACYYGNGQGYLNLPMIKKLKFRSGWKAEPANALRLQEVNISLNKAGQYHATLCYSVGDSTSPSLPYDEGSTLGFDMGVKTLVTVSDGTKYDLPKAYRKTLAKVQLAQRKLSRCQKGSNRRKRAKLRVARLHQRAKNQRVDFVHKLTRKIVDDNQVNAFCFETLSNTDMLRKGHRSLSRALQQASFADFVSIMEQKSARAGKTCLKADRYDATSKTCHVCGERTSKMSLAVREWVCDTCGNPHDRDINAAKNVKFFALKREAERVLTLSPAQKVPSGGRVTDEEQASQDACNASMYDTSSRHRGQHGC